MKMTMMRHMTNSDEGFYEIMGPIFGSREITRKTGDRFYDDDNKVWHIVTDVNNEVTAVMSTVDGTIKNIYGEDIEALLENVKPLCGVVPKIYSEQYRNAGYNVLEYSKNYVYIRRSEDEH